MNKYTFKFDYEVPEFTDIVIETTSEDIELVKNLAIKEFSEMYPEAIDPQLISWTKNAN